MHNRLFDIDRNVYLNSYYIYILLQELDSSVCLNDLMLSLYLFKNPNKLIDILMNLGIKIESKLFDEYQIDNIQSNMMKYSSSIYIDGFNEAMSYLYNKGIIDYSINSNLIMKTDSYFEVDSAKIPKTLINITRYIHLILNDYGNEFIKQQL